MTLATYNGIEPNMLRQNPAYPVSRTSGDILLFEDWFLMGKNVRTRKTKGKNKVILHLESSKYSRGPELMVQQKKTNLTTLI